MRALSLPARGRFAGRDLPRLPFTGYRYIRVFNKNYKMAFIPRFLDSSSSDSPDLEVVGWE